MIQILFAILMLIIFGKLLAFAFKASWGIAVVLLAIVFLPVILIGLAVLGLIYIAFPILLIIGVVSLFVTHV